MRPTSLADFLHAWTYDPRPYLTKLLVLKGKTVEALDREGKRRFREKLLTADRFVLSDAFIERATTRACESDIHKLLAIADLARLPSKPVLVEYNDEIRYRTQVRNGTAQPLQPEDDAKEDWARAGFLYLPVGDGWHALHVSSSPNSMPVWPVSSGLLGPGDKDFYDISGTYAKSFLDSAWGIVEKGSNGLGFAVSRELSARGCSMLDLFFTLPISALGIEMSNNGNDSVRDRMSGMIPAMARQNAGSLRLATSILASLNTVPTRIVRTVPQGTFQYRFRNLPKFDQKTVHIDARPGHEVHVYDRSMHEATGRHNRRHEVRGHWRDVSRLGPIVCAHEPADVDGNYALCGKCTRFIRWIEHHERGDAELGFVFHDHYEVQ